MFKAIAEAGWATSATAGAATASAASAELIETVGPNASPAAKKSRRLNGVPKHEAGSFSFFRVSGIRLFLRKIARQVLGPECFLDATDSQRGTALRIVRSHCADSVWGVSARIFCQ